ncbi:oligosaccharide flippase family protein [Microcoleus sp. POL10_C6]|uniref:oligosaccharide flippase family protein n=1 Tax=Microcoleus sp. POL10_C6 TaxID=2818852 RepID=UPI002FCFFA86
MQQLKPLTLRRNFSWTFTGNLVYAASQWGMLVVLAKLGSPEMVGKFTLGLAVTAPVFMLTNLQLRSIQATDARKEYLFSDYLSLRLIGTALAFLIIFVITISSGYSWDILLVVVALAFAKAFESISDIFYGLLQHHERMDRISLSLMLRGTLSLLMLGAGVYLTGSVFVGSVGLAIAWAFVLVSYDIPSGIFLLNAPPADEIETERQGEEDKLSNSPQQLPNTDENPISQPKNKLLRRWHLKTLTKLLWLSVPLGFVMMLISLNINIPRYFIEHYLGAHQLGIFSALSYLIVAGQMVISALAQSVSPRLAKYYAAGNSKSFRTLLLKLVGIALGLGSAGVVVAVVAGRPILTLLYDPEYAQQVDVFVLLMVAAGINYVSYFLGYGITAARYFRVQMPLFMVVTASSALICLWLIPTQGLRGAAISLILGSVIQIVSCLAVLIHAINKITKH